MAITVPVRLACIGCGEETALEATLGQPGPRAPDRCSACESPAGFRVVSAELTIGGGTAELSGPGVVVTGGVDVQSIIAGPRGAMTLLLQIRGGPTVRVPCEPEAARQVFAAKASRRPPRWKLVLVREE